MGRNAIYGGDVELAILSKLYNVHIIVHQFNNEFNIHKNEFLCENEANCLKVHLLYDFNGYHYETLYKKQTRYKYKLNIEMNINMK